MNRVAGLRSKMKLPKPLRISLALILAGILPGEIVMSKETSNIVKTYMPFTLPVDPANVRTLVDLDLSYALGTTLVGWSKTRELVSGLAESWSITGEKEITFKIGETSKWSDGTAVTAEQAVQSLLRAKRVHGDSLKTLYDYVTAIEAKDAKTLVFKLNVAAATSGVVKKLTEPMYGIVRVKNGDALDLTATTGPFMLNSVSDSEIELALNKLWIFTQPNMPKAVQIRRPPAGEEVQDSFLKDSWANLLGSSSLLPVETSDKFKKAKYEVWHRNLDKIFFFAPGPRLTSEDGRSLFKYLNRRIDRTAVTKGLSGFNLTEQFFPQGYVLFDPEFQKSNLETKLPDVFRKKPLEILAAESRMSEILQRNIRSTIKELTGVEPTFKLVSLANFEKNRAEGNYDFVAGSLPVNDPNVEGAMGFFFGLTPPIIPNAGEGSKDFQARVKKARLNADQLERNLEYRRIFTESTREGSLLPLFHYSTIVIAKEGIDLSQVPTTDETVAFSKVRFK
jgi:MarR-like DNA-binding transcriptional regulator SgrR of sgrS sRNA